MLIYLVPDSYSLTLPACSRTSFSMLDLTVHRNKNILLTALQWTFSTCLSWWHWYCLLSFCEGFSVVNRGCCGIGRNRGQITCLPFQTPCPNRNQYVFWDAFHPTEAANILMGRMAFSGNSNFVYPINIRQLAELWSEPLKWESCRVTVIYSFNDQVYI